VAFQQVSANLTDAINESSILKLEQQQLDEEHDELSRLYLKAKERQTKLNGDLD
jgi:hypothetical protein